MDFLLTLYWFCIHQKKTENTIFLFHFASTKIAYYQYLLFNGTFGRYAGQRRSEKISFTPPSSALDLALLQAKQWRPEAVGYSWCCAADRPFLQAPCSPPRTS